MPLKIEDKLKSFEDRFLSRYPGGFADPEIQQQVKKHKMEKLTDFAQEAFSKKAFDDSSALVEDMIRMVSRSSMVSVFEKPKFRDFVHSLTAQDKVFLSESLKLFLHGKKQETGFERMVDLLASAKLAKWSLLTVFGAYYAPSEEVFIKPTTCKNVLRTFSFDDITYSPKPTWDFYQEYRERINAMKMCVDESLRPSNAAFSGFLMMSMDNH